MTLPASPNPVSISQINTELGRSSSSQFSLGTDAEGRKLASIGQSGISPSPNQIINQGVFRSKARNKLTFTTNTNTVSLLNSAIATNYSAGNTYLTVTINPNVRIGAANTTVPSLTVVGFTAGDDVELINNGYIQGAGGSGGKGNGGNGHNRSTIDPGSAGVGGGTALFARFNVAVTNNGYIWGGGGGGGGGIGGNTGGKSRDPIGGGGGGGGAGIVGGSGGLGGTNGVGRLGDNGSAGTSTTGGAGGPNTGAGGAGGGPGQPGQSAFYAGGAAGRYLDGTSFVNWVTVGNTLGSAL